MRAIYLNASIVGLIVITLTELITSNQNIQTIHQLINFNDSDILLNITNDVYNSEQNSKLLIYRIKKIAKQNPDGFTVILPQLDPLTTGIVSAYADTQNSFTDDDLIEVIKHAQSHDNLVGGWLNEDNDRYYYDSCKSFTDREEAIQFGRANKQLSIYDIDNNELIWL